MGIRMPDSQRIRKRKEHEQTRKEIIDFVHTNEGLEAKQIAKKLNLNNGIVINHLNTAHRQKQVGRYFAQSNKGVVARWMKSYEKYHDPNPTGSRHNSTIHFDPYPDFDKDCEDWLKPRKKSQEIYNPWQRA
jgi:DNA-binding CsgD family transcriptional regulator